MSPDLMNAIVGVISAVLGALAVWAKMRNGGAQPAPIDPTKPSPTPPIPSTGRPILDALIRLWLEREAKRTRADHEAQAVEFLAALQGEAKKPS